MADITWVTAGIGQGKTLFAVRTNCKELRNSERALVNNLPWEYERLGDWCEKVIDKPVDLRLRLRILKETEVPEFFRYFPMVCGDVEQVLRERGRLMVAARPDKKKEVNEWFAEAMEHHKAFEEGVLPMEKIRGHDLPMIRLRQGDGGILYTLDEVHLHFPSRYWQEHGLGVEHYMSQLRKLNDDLILISQHREKVDKNFRRNGTEWIVLQNMSKTLLVGGVALKGRFRAHQFQTEPAKGDKPTSSPWFKMYDDEYINLYRTMAGSGLVGHLNPEGSRREKGRHWSYWVLTVVVIVLIAWSLPRVFSWGLGKFLGGFAVNSAETAKKAINKGTIPATSVNQTNAILEKTNVVENKVVVSHKVRERDVSPLADTAVYCTGYSYIGGDCLVFLSNGITARSSDNAIQLVLPNRVVVYGQEFPVITKEIAAEPLPAAGEVSKALIQPEKKVGAVSTLLVIGQRQNRSPSISTVDNFAKLRKNQGSKVVLGGNN